MVETTRETSRPIKPRPGPDRYLQAPCPRCAGTGSDGRPFPPGGGDAIMWACLECHGAGWITMAHKLCIDRNERGES